MEEGESVACRWGAPDEGRVQWAGTGEQRPATSGHATRRAMNRRWSRVRLFRWRRRIWRRTRCCSTGERSSALTTARSLMMACFAHTTTPQESHRHVAGQRALSNGCWSSVETKSVLS